MIEPKFINKDEYNSKSLNYKELLDEGIELIQKFSGNQWSDYNYHDPGITFLEQICFALTDLGYKSNFPIEDILLAYTDKFDLENNNLLITIDDDGSGIPEKEYENVFKPFYKIDKGRTETKSSVGLGLSIASDIVRSHGGNIILNKSKMNGLSVKISLPV